MKKLVFIAIAFAALALAGCEQEKFVGAPQDGVLTVLSAGREAGPATKSALTEDGDNYWSVGDKILVAWAGQNPETFTSKEKEPGETAKFQGFLPTNNSGDDTKYAIYPAEEGNVVNKDGSFDLKFHAEQDGVEGTYDPSAFLAVAQSSDNNLAFYNVLGLLRLNFVDADIRKVVLRPGATPDEEEEDEVIDEPEEEEEDPIDDEEEEEEDDEEPVEEPVDNGFIPGGVLTVEGKTPELTAWSEELSEVVLKAPKGKNFATGTDYYLAVPPCVLENGVTFEIMHSDGSSSLVSIDGPVEVERSKIHDVTLDSDPYIPVSEIIFDSEEEEVEVECTITLEPTVKPKKATDKTLDWSSEDESIATVEDGVVTGVAEGTVIITATAYDDEGNVEAEGQITIIVTCPWVDLGLSVLWAKCNLDAESPEEAGGYYAWGETETKESYTWKTYLLRDAPADWYEGLDDDNFNWNAGWILLNKYTWRDGQVNGIWYEYLGCFDDEESFEAYNDEYYEDFEDGYLVCDNYTVSDGTTYWDIYGFIGDDVYYFYKYDYEDDAARVNLGGDWRTPSSEEWEELMNKCDWAWADDYEDTGVCGYLVTSLVEGFEGASIFIPAAGFMYDSDLLTEVWDGYPAGFYWSDESSWSCSDCAVTAYIDEEEISMWGQGSSYYVISRCFGLPVRPVISKPTEGEPARYSLPSAKRIRPRAGMKNVPNPDGLKAYTDKGPVSGMFKSIPANKSDLLPAKIKR